jgi:hypothetical protein
MYEITLPPSPFLCTLLLEIKRLLEVDNVISCSFLRNEDLIISQFECTNLPGFKNLADLISDFI